MHSSSRSPEKLTAAETTVAHYLREGWTNKEISLQLNKSEGTVKIQVAAILRKLGVRTRGRAAAELRDRMSMVVSLA